MNHKAVRELMQDAALRTDPSISYGFGRQTDFNAVANKRYPFIWLDPLTATGSLTEGVYNFTKVFAVGVSFLYQDRVDSVQDDYTPLLDKAFDLATRFWAFINNADQVVLSSPSFSPAIKVFSDCLTGYVLTFNIEVPDSFDYCAIVDTDGRLCGCV